MVMLYYRRQYMYDSKQKKLEQHQNNMKKTIIISNHKEGEHT